MNDELKSLLEKYDSGSISAGERDRLKELISTEEGRLTALQSSVPEAIFLADEEQELPEWDDYWAKFENRLIDQSRWSPSKPKFWRYAAAAAVVFIVALVSIPYLFKGEPHGVDVADNQLALFNYQLKYRVLAEVLPQVRQYMSEDSSLRINGETNSLEIEDYGKNIQILEQVLPLLDREPIQMKFSIKFLVANNPNAVTIKQVDSLPMDKLDTQGFDIAEDLEITPVEGRKFQTIIDDRYEISCFIQLSPDATEAEIVYFRIYDRVTKDIVLTEAGIALPAGWTRSVETEQKAQNGVPIVVAISLLPTESRD